MNHPRTKHLDTTTAVVRLTLWAAALLLAFACSSTGSGDEPATGGSSGTGTSGGSSGAGTTGGSGGHAGDAGDGSQAGDAGSGAQSGASDELCGERPGGSVWATNVLRFENSGAGITVQIRRTFEMSGVGESSIFRLDAFALRVGATVHCVTDGASLEYENSHHNWTDIARAEVDGVHYELRPWLDGEVTFEWTNTLSGVDGEGNVVLPETTLIPTGSPPNCYTCPGEVPVYISEVQFHNVSTLADEAGEYEPWIEIFNPQSDAVDLTGWTLSDDFGRRDKWTLPSVSIPRHETLVVFADGDVDQGELHASFTLELEGAELVLTMPDGTTDGGAVHEAQGADQSSTYDWASSVYVVTDDPTPGAVAIE